MRMQSRKATATTGRETRRSTRTLEALALIICLLAGGALTPAQVLGPGKAPAPGGPRLDTELADRLSRGSDDDVERVIIRMKPGRKGRLTNQLRGEGHRVDHDFNLIEGFAGRISKRRLREMLTDPDVLGVSVDADMQAMGLTTDVTGTALNSAYSLRSTLGLQTAGAAVTKTFQQGASNYTSTIDGGVNSGSATTNYGSARSVKVEVEESTKRGMLLQFGALFGTGATQIPVGSTITSATLRIATVSAGVPTWRSAARAWPRAWSAARWR